jgi:hypothetical protein
LQLPAAASRVRVANDKNPLINSDCERDYAELNQYLAKMKNRSCLSALSALRTGGGWLRKPPPTSWRDAYYVLFNLEKPTCATFGYYLFSQK